MTMRVIVVSLFISLLFCESSLDAARTSLENFLGIYRLGRTALMDFTLALQQNNKSPLRKNKLQNRISKSISFPCNLTETRSTTRPNSIHKLRPGDIDVIAALGDSLTAGIGISAINIFEMGADERGKSFSIGGEADWRKYTTLPNILKVFNPNLIGYSLKSSLTIQAESQLNLGEPAAISADMPYMTNQLIGRIKSDKRINITQDWKMVTLFIGSNDFCSQICYLNDPVSSLEKHMSDLKMVLRALRDNLPRTIVNVVPPPNLRLLVELQITDPLCYFTHLLECPCLFGFQFEHRRNLFYKIMIKWQEIDLEVSTLEEFDKDDFTVVAQPFSVKYTFPTVSQNIADLTYLSADCFHFSQKMHARVANDLWNSIMTPVGKKPLDGTELFKIFKCPTVEAPYIFTRKNS